MSWQTRMENDLRKVGQWMKDTTGWRICNHLVPRIKGCQVISQPVICNSYVSTLGCRECSAKRMRGIANDPG
jgi:hypothetical protein